MLIERFRKSNSLHLLILTKQEDSLLSLSRLIVGLDFDFNY